MYRRLVTAYEKATDEQLAGNEIANRTLAKVMHDEYVGGQAWPSDASVAIDKMAPLDGANGEVLTSDLATWTFDPETGTSKSGATDPVAKDAADQEAYLTKLSLFLTSQASRH